MQTWGNIGFWLKDAKLPPPPLRPPVKPWFPAPFMTKGSGLAYKSLWTTRSWISLYAKPAFPGPANDYVKNIDTITSLCCCHVCFSRENFPFPQFPAWFYMLKRYTVKKNCAKFWCGQQWRESNNVGVGKFLLPCPLVLHHRRKHRSLAHSDLVFFYSVQKCSMTPVSPVRMSWLQI
jgi:hypothetical protein